MRPAGIVAVLAGAAAAGGAVAACGSPPSLAVACEVDAPSFGLTQLGCRVKPDRTVAIVVEVDSPTAGRIEVDRRGDVHGEQRFTIPIDALRLAEQITFVARDGDGERRVTVGIPPTSAVELEVVPVDGGQVEVRARTRAANRVAIGGQPVEAGPAGHVRRVDPLLELAPADVAAATELRLAVHVEAPTGPATDTAATAPIDEARRSALFVRGEAHAWAGEPAPGAPVPILWDAAPDLGRARASTAPAALTRVGDATRVAIVTSTAAATRRCGPYCQGYGCAPALGRYVTYVQPRSRVTVHAARTGAELAARTFVGPPIRCPASVEVAAHGVEPARMSGPFEAAIEAWVARVP